MRSEGYGSWVCVSGCLSAEAAAAVRSWGGRDTYACVTQFARHAIRKWGYYYSCYLHERVHACSSSNTHSVIIAPILLEGRLPPPPPLPPSYLTSGASVRPENAVTYSAGNRLNSTWNTTRFKVASFFLFSLRLLPKVFRILPLT